FWKAPQLAAGRNRRFVIQEHAVGISAFATPELDRDHLAGFGVVAETSGIWHADELVFDQRLIHLERLRYDRAHPIRIGSIGDDHEFSIDETIRARRVSRAWQAPDQHPSH